MLTGRVWNFPIWSGYLYDRLSTYSCLILHHDIRTAIPSGGAGSKTTRDGMRLNIGRFASAAYQAYELH